MKLLKSTGLVLGLVLVATAFLAVASASAETTKLCRVNEEKCSKANTYALSFENFKGAAIAAPEEAKLVMPGLVTVSCPTGKLASTLKETTGALLGEVSKWNTFNCTPTASKCTLLPPKEIETGYTAEVTATGGGNGSLVISGKGGPELIAQCPAGSPVTTCIYTAPTIKFTVKGGPGGGAGKNPQLSTETSMTKVPFGSSAFCPNTATYVLLYQMVEPGSALFITH
jgi:hypothetical protein